MPVEKKSTQAAATRKYEQKVGLISKSYKLRKELVEGYAEACAKEGVEVNERHPD